MKRGKALIHTGMAVLASMAVVVGSAASLQNNVYAAGAGTNRLDTIRVALFINSAKFNSLESVVTLSSAAGLEIGIRSAGAVHSWASVAGAAEIRASLDQYSVNMLETVDFAAASALNAKLQSMKYDAFILSRAKQGKTVFQVYLGTYASKEEAEGAKLQALKDASVAASVKAAPPAVTGPLHLSAGTYPTEAAAAAQAAVYSLAGIAADIALQEDASGKLQYAVWLGAEATAEQLNLVKQQALKVVPGAPLQPADTSAAYLLRRQDATASATGAESVPHFAAGAGEQKTWVHPKQEGITVKERSNRNYRGDMELSAYRSKLAVINELPMQQYLYSVVGSELNSGWPLEALKAQAVAARTFAIKQGTKYEIAQVSDTTLDQAYYGMQREFAAANKAVDATKDEVLTNKDGLITPVFSSNAGGKTADPSEVWGNPASYLKSVASPDQGAEAGKAKWYRIRLADGRTGYVHSMYLKDTGQKNTDGAAYYEATEADVNVRLAPYVDNAANPAIDQLAVKEKVLVLGQETESNAYSWVRGPYDAAALKSKLADAGIAINGSLQSLEISKRGPSGRVTEMKVNGQVIQVDYPDALRSAFGGLPSTLFEIEQAGSYTGSTSTPSEPTTTAPPSGSAGMSIAGAARSGESPDKLYVLSGSQTKAAEADKTGLYVLGATGQAKPAANSGGVKTPAPSAPVTAGGGSKQFIFRGTGFGHGLGMSQWGARGFAEQGYDYKKILQTYYSGVTITKE